MRRLFETLFYMWVALVLAVPGHADDGGKDWRVAPKPPELQLRFEDRGEKAPCPDFGATPATETIECWAAHVDRALSRDASGLAEVDRLACLPAWEITEPGQGGCPEEAARCVRPKAGLFEGVPSDLPIGSNIRAAWATAVDLAREYTTFQLIRNGQALNPHRPRISGLAIS